MSSYKFILYLDIVSILGMTHSVSNKKICSAAIWWYFRINTHVFLIMNIHSLLPSGGKFGNNMTGLLIKLFLPLFHVHFENYTQGMSLRKVFLCCHLVGILKMTPKYNCRDAHKMGAENKFVYELHSDFIPQIHTR